MLQFLWRDLTSSYDIVGPYFTSAQSVDMNFLITCIFGTVKLFQIHGLKTSLLVSDGASSNLATIKATHGHIGAYSNHKSAQDQFEITPWMLNPFHPPDKIYWMVCPTHQVYTQCIDRHPCQYNYIIAVKEYHQRSLLFKIGRNKGIPTIWKEFIWVG